MTKFGSFAAAVEKPMQIFEGEHLVVNGTGETVSIMADDEKGMRRVVGVVRLSEGQCIKKVV